MNGKKESVFKEEDIRPDHLKINQKQKIDADIQRLLSHRDDFVEVNCPACGAIESKSAFEKNELNYVICKSCETMYVNPRPTSETLAQFYSESENYSYWNKYVFPASEEIRREKIFRPRVEKIVGICKQYGVKPNTLMEVGSGFGTFCEELNTTGYFKRIIGIEPTPDLAETCRKKGIEVIEKPVEQVELKTEEIDVIVSFEVIEHLFCPEEFLKSCSDLLPKGGLIVVTCPNVKGFDIDVLQAAANSVDHEHLNYFHPKSLELLFHNCGFEVLELLTPGRLDAELVRKKILNGEFEIGGRQFLKQVLVDEWDRIGEKFQDFLSDNLLSSHMWIVARKG